MNGIFKEETGVALYISNFMIICHECQNLYSPLRVWLVPTDYKVYYADTYSRLCWIYTYLDQPLCEHLSRMVNNWSPIYVHEENDTIAVLHSKNLTGIDKTEERRALEDTWEMIRTKAK